MRPALTVVPSTSSTTRSPRVFPCAVRPPIDFEAPTPTPQRDRLLGGRPQACACEEDATGKLDIAFEDMGEQQLKNIARPVRAYRAMTAVGSAPMRSSSGPPLPDKPSIAVLPFANMSGDPEQEYFADGMVEEIITALTRIRWLFVIARNSTFTYKGQAIDVKRVGRELGV